MPNPRNKLKICDPDDSVSLRSLIEFVRKAQLDLANAGEEDSALRFEILYEYLTKDFRGAYLTYTSRALGL